MTHEVTPRQAFAEAMSLVHTEPDCRRRIAGKALRAYNLAVFDQAAPSGLWETAEAFARQQVESAVAAHSLACACITPRTKHALVHSRLSLPLHEDNN